MRTASGSTSRRTSNAVHAWRTASAASSPTTTTTTTTIAADGTAASMAAASRTPDTRRPASLLLTGSGSKVQASAAAAFVAGVDLGALRELPPGAGGNGRRAAGRRAATWA